MRGKILKTDPYLWDMSQRYQKMKSGHFTKKRSQSISILKDMMEMTGNSFTG